MANSTLHLVHVKSNVENKAPSASTLNYGEIAVNYNVNSPALYIKDSADNIVKFWPEGGNAKIFYGECSSPASATTKTVACTAFTQADLVPGAIVYTRFVNTNSGAVSSLRLNVNETGAYPIKKIYNYAYANLTNAAEIYSGMTQAMVFTGSYWVVHGVDVNSTYELRNLPEGNARYIADSVIYRYQMLFQRFGENSEKLTPLNNNNNVTGTTKTMLTGVTFDPFGKIYYYTTTTTINANANTNAYINYHHTLVDLRYTFNITSSSPLVGDKDLYLKVIPQSDGSVKLATDEVPLVQTLPSANDGFWYIFLGRMYDKYRMDLRTDHPVYMHNGTELVELLNPEIMAGLKNSIVTVDDELDTGSTNPVANSVITKTIYDNELVIAASLNDLETRKADKSYVDNAISSATIDVDSELDTGSTNPIANSAITKVILEDEEITSAALNDLNDRKADKSYVDSAISSVTIEIDSELDSASTNPVENRAIWQMIVDDERVIASSLNDLKANKADKSYVDNAVSSITIDVDTEFDTGSTNPIANSVVSMLIMEDEKAISAAFNDLETRKADKSYVDTAVSSITIDVEIKANKINNISYASISTASTANYPTAKAVYDEIHPDVATSMPAGGFNPNVFYRLGVITGTRTFTLKTSGIDTSAVNHYYWTFDAGTPAPNITWPSGLTWYGGSAPVPSTGHHYEISVLNNIAVAMEI